MSEYNALTIEGLCRELSEPENTLIICHTRPDGNLFSPALRQGGTRLPNKARGEERNDNGNSDDEVF